MRQEVDELIALVKCKEQLMATGDIYTLSTVLSTLAEVISVQNRQALAKLLVVPDA